MELKRSIVVHIGPYQIPVAVKNVLCSDGWQRRAKITGEPFTIFDIPASVKVKGKSVSGFVNYDADTRVHRFHAYQNRKNGYLL